MTLLLFELPPELPFEPPEPFEPPFELPPPFEPPEPLFEDGSELLAADESLEVPFPPLLSLLAEMVSELLLCFAEEEKESRGVFLWA
jgi:hypothetical protein